MLYHLPTSHHFGLCFVVGLFVISVIFGVLGLVVGFWVGVLVLFCCSFLF